MQEFPSIWLRRILENIWYNVPQYKYSIYYLMKLIPISTHNRLEISYNWYTSYIYYWEEFVNWPLYEIKDDEIVDCLALLIIKMHTDNLIKF